MRINSYIQDLWNSGGPFIGDNRPSVRLTVRDPWDITGVPVQDRAGVTASTVNNVIFGVTKVGVGNHTPRGVPIRWFQKEDGSQEETEIPNLVSYSVDESIDADASTLTFEISNQAMFDNASVQVAEQAGRPGYFTANRGDSPNAFARWGHTQNAWNNVLVPNALIYAYEGFGGQDLSVPAAVTAGNLLLKGIWLIDTVSVTSKGTLSVECRSTAKLLLDQQLYKPLIPITKYPLKYYRWRTEDRQVTATSGVYTAGNPATGTPNTAAGDRAITYYDSSEQKWYGPSVEIQGHRPTDSIDNMQDTYWLSVGNSGPDKVFATVWIEFTVNDWVNAVYLHPWAGYYTMYVSVMEGGTWQGEQTVPYDYRPLIGRQATVVNTGADIPYVASYSVPYEESREYLLPRLYNAERVRLSFRHLYDSGLGTWRYRAGAREIAIRGTAGQSSLAKSSSPGQVVAPIFYAAAALYDPYDLNRTGYMTVSNYGYVDVFGDCREYDANRADDATVLALLDAFVDAAGSDAAEISSVALTPNGDGYWILYSRGIVRSFGAAEYAGEPYGSFNFESGAPGGGINKAATIISTNTGQGYWVITFAGEIFSYGDAPAYDDATTLPSEFFHGACAHRGRPGDEEGLYLVSTYGAVYTYGAARWLGNYNESENVSNAGQQEIAIDIQSTHTQQGYWILTTSGKVQAFGDAVDHGEIETPDFIVDPDTQVMTSLSSYDRYYHMLAAPHDGGYLLTDGDGKIKIFGDVDYFGSPTPGEVGQLRYDGNYLDYTDIVRDLLLWSGFLLYDPTTSGTERPPVYGNLEDTGAYAKEPLPDEMFDKKPVIDAINELRETVGFIFRIDDEGAARFEAPNVWEPGNWTNEGVRVEEIPEIDERFNLVDHSAAISDSELRSEIIIASDDPDGQSESVQFTRYTPQNAVALRGLLKPAMWVNGWFVNTRDRQVMAELIAMHTWFAQRQGQVTCAANPCICVDDQVRIFERTTGESYLHYVRGISRSFDPGTGNYTMSLTTHWLGEGDDWLVSADQSADAETHFIISPITKEFLLTSNSARIKSAFQPEP